MGPTAIMTVPVFSMFKNKEVLVVPRQRHGSLFGLVAMRV